MLLLADRNFGANDLLAEITATGADMLVRLTNDCSMPAPARYSDGSHSSTLGALRTARPHPGGIE